MAATFSKATPLYELVFVAFQATFAAITCCLILGSIVERIKFSAVLLFMVIWFTFSYIPVAHMVWFWAGPDAYTDPAKADAVTATAGYIWQMGALDFAGGTVVHINAGVAGLVGAVILGKRVGFGKEPMPPHSLTMTMIGASMLWFGWFGFNAGSALEANGSAALAFMNTYLATACAVLSWMFCEWLVKGKPSMLGAASGAVAGLVAITPAAGNVGIPGAFAIGLGVGVVCLWGVTGLKKMIKADDSLDVFGVHALGGIFGALTTGIFNAPSLGGPGSTSGLGEGHGRLSGHLAAAADPDQSCGHRYGLDRGGGNGCVPGRQSGHGTAGDRRTRTRGSRHHVARRTRLRHVIGIWAQPSDSPGLPEGRTGAFYFMAIANAPLPSRM